MAASSARIIFLVARDRLAGMNPQYWYFWIGIILMLVVLLMPRGILGWLTRIVGQARRVSGGADMVLRTEALQKSFGSLTVAREISLELPRGARHALIGPNGAGKTTLINLITGQLRPDSGRILLGGEDVTGTPIAARVRRGLTRTFQINTLFPSLTPIEAVMLAICERENIRRAILARASARTRRRSTRPSTSSQQLRLGDVATRATRTLPYGQQRLLEIALALATRPKVLLARRACRRRAA